MDPDTAAGVVGVVGLDNWHRRVVAVAAAAEVVDVDGDGGAGAGDGYACAVAVVELVFAVHWKWELGRGNSDWDARLACWACFGKGIVVAC